MYMVFSFSRSCHQTIRLLHMYVHIYNMHMLQRIPYTPYICRTCKVGCKFGLFGSSSSGGLLMMHNPGGEESQRRKILEMVKGQRHTVQGHQPSHRYTRPAVEGPDTEPKRSTANEKVISLRAGAFRVLGSRSGYSG